MATTKIWAIKDSVKRVIEYARNPDKTEYSDLKNAIHYAADGKKTEFFEDEKVFLVTSLNCNGDPYESMMQVREHFGDRGSILAHHAYQSRRDHRLCSAHGALIYSSKAHLCRPDQRKIYPPQKRTRGISRR